MGAEAGEGPAEIAEGIDTDRPAGRHDPKQRRHTMSALAAASEEAIEFADNSMEMISYYAILGSAELAKERGVYGTYAGSKWSKGYLPIDTLKLLEKEKVAVVPGNAFGKVGEGYIRCSFATSMENLKESMRRINRFIKGV